MFHPVSLQGARVRGHSAGRPLAMCLDLPRPGRLLQPGRVRVPRTEVDFAILVGRGRTGFQFSSYGVFSLVCQVRLLWPGVLTSNGVASAAGGKHRVLEPEVLWRGLDGRRGGF